VEHELARGVSSATARKHLTMGQAALESRAKEERIGKVPKLPDAGSLTAARAAGSPARSTASLMLVPKPWARQMFWLLAFATGARTGAILDLTRDRVDLAAARSTFECRASCTATSAAPSSRSRHRSSPRLVAAFERADPACPLRGVA
jgi:hypothetical protein